MAPSGVERAVAVVPAAIRRRLDIAGEDTMQTTGAEEGVPMVIIAGYAVVDANERDRYVEEHRDLVSRARSAAGCIHVAITADSIDPARVAIVEVWESATALESWRAQANAPDPGIPIVQLAVRRYDATDGGSLF
jgi:quinol monooxygenase YgiN